MAIHVVCPQCQSTYTVLDELRGQKARCKKCATSFVIEAEPEAAPAELPAKRKRPEPVRERYEDDEDDRPRRSKPARARKKTSAIVPLAIVGGAIITVLAALGAGIGVWKYWKARQAEEVANAPVNRPNPNTTSPTTPVTPPKPFWHAALPLHEGKEIAGVQRPEFGSLPEQSREEDGAESPPRPKSKPKEILASVGGQMAPDVLLKVKQATFYIRVAFSDGRRGSGSGFLIDQEGTVVTNAHVLGMLGGGSKKPKQIEVFVHSGEPNEKKLSAEFLGVDRGTDLALVRIPKDGLPEPLTVKTAEDLVETQPLWVSGYPLGEGLGKNVTVTACPVSSLRRRRSGELHTIQVQGDMMPGNSGGPVVDAAGNVVGVAVRIIPNTKFNFAVPGDMVTRLVDGRYGDLSGTSMACPHVAGAVALVWNQYTKWNYLQVKDQILGTVDPIAALQGRTVTGGRLNVHSALTAIPAGPRALSTTPNTGVLGPISTLRVAFDRGINPATFTPADITDFEGPGGTITVTGVNVVPGTNNTRFDLTFAAQDAIGEYVLTLGPDIQDDAGNLMDQNRNGTTGEVPGDQFTARFTVLDPCLAPDGYGYQACVHPFADESIFGQSGTFTILNATDDSSAPVNLGKNTFTFYGVTYTGAGRLHVSSNGLISLGFANPGDTNTNLGLFPLQPTIAVLWDDLIKTGGDPMVVGRFEDLDGDGTDDRLVIEWYEVEIRPSSATPITFQAYLYLNTDGESDLVFNYFNLDTGDGNRLGAAATVGIKAAGFQGPNRNVVSFNRQSPYLQSNQALRFSASGSLPSFENPPQFAGMEAAVALLTRGGVRRNAVAVWESGSEVGESFRW